MTTATNAVILELCVPVWGCIAGLALKREKRCIFKVLGIGIAIAGGLVMLEVEKFNMAGDMVIGNLLIIGTTVLYTLGYLLCGEKLFKKLLPLTTNR